MSLLPSLSLHLQHLPTPPLHPQPPPPSESEQEPITVGTIFLLLESNKALLNLAFHSVSPSTFDEVFLKVVEKHGVSEEDLNTNRKGISAGDVAMFIIFPPLLFWRWAKGRQDAELERQRQNQVQGVRGVLPESEVGMGQGDGVVGGEGELREPEGQVSGREEEVVVFPNMQVAAPSSGFSLWPPPLYVLVRNFIRKRRGQ